VPRSHDAMIHTRRDSAESFGQVAAQYDRYRPSYPARLVDDLLAPGPRRVLDVGCGTGKAARLFATRGVDVLGVEFDPAMAAVARDHGLAVEVSSFEEWDDAGRTFDLIISAQAWHWIDPGPGAAKAARLLNPGGELGVFWNFDELDADDQAVVDDVYRAVAPELVSAPGVGSDDTHRRRLAESGCFSRVEAVTYPAVHEWPLDDWIGNLATHSDHLLLAERLPVFLDRLRAAMSARGPVVRTTGGTYLIRARG